MINQAIAVVENPSLREAREGFKALQQALGALPLKPKDRQHFRNVFDKLWHRLQERSQAHRIEWQQRQQEGIRRLEEALHKVESFIQRKTLEIQTQEQRLANSNWHQQDQIEQDIQKNKAVLEDACRRQSELQTKLADARQRLNAH